MLRTRSALRSDHARNRLCGIRYTAQGADGIARFYQQIISTPAEVVEDHGGRHARVAVGLGQNLIFRETDKPLPPYDGHHIQVYVADFSGPYKQLLKRGLIFEESDQHQYRFKDIVDPKNGKKVLVHDRTRSPQHEASDLSAAAGKPESVAKQYELCTRI